MAGCWICLKEGERDLVLNGLAELERRDGTIAQRAVLLANRLGRSEALPQTVLRVEGGIVEVEGNPNPVTIYDYDCDGVEDLLVDEIGKPCIVSECKPASA
ncbi:MAG: hypothetical protein JO261_14495 [Alphaproteobacteria bacterium]|nr:hypothetical protein [Alphaproteobacteria bacterium]MBV9694904.1 hypothetical protein [Alphaproteobacteria bacterium]